LTFFKFQESNGNVPDGFIPRESASVGYKFRESKLASEFLAHKNTVETDQETSLVQAIRKYVDTTGDRSLLSEQVDHQSVLERLGMALKYVFAERFDRQHGLIWGATTVDWGDVQPEHDWGVELDDSSHRTLDIYDNAMMVIAIEDFKYLAGPNHPDASYWEQTNQKLRKNIRHHLWNENTLKFIPHIYLDGSPFAEDFREEDIFYHGGTAIAIEANLLTREEVLASLEQMKTNVKKANASSIGLTVYPPYPAGSFKNPSMTPYGYQNGGDWCWFGGRMIQQLIRFEFVEEAYTELKPMINRVLEHGDFHEWWSRDNQPRGSGQFRGSAGVLGKAIKMLQAWAMENQSQP
jgi:glycogen debranching enzyme